MKSERRHELQHNTLDTELHKTVDFLKRHLNSILWLIVVVAAGFLVGKFVSNKLTQHRLGPRVQYAEAMGDQALLTEERLERLAALAEQDTDLRVAALALLSRADLQVASAMLGMDRPDAMYQGAQADYQKALDRFSDEPILAARAHVGLAVLAENRGEYELARSHYEAVLAIDGAAGTPASAIAMRNKDSLPELVRPVAMTPPPMPVTQPADVGPTGPGAGLEGPSLDDLLGEPSPEEFPGPSDPAVP